MKNTFQTSQLLEILGLSRDALRYYENVGVINPKKNALNQYRQFNEGDLYTLMVIDFYKKRNVTVKEVKEVQSGTTIKELAKLFQQKSDELEEEIINQMHMLEKIKASKQFCERVDNNLNRFSLRELPAFQIVQAFSDFNAFLEYPSILEKMNHNRDDLLSRMVRVYTFTGDIITDSKMYLMKEHGADQLSGEVFEQQFPCMYTIVEDSSNVDTEKDKEQTVFKAALAWGKKQGFKPKGSAFVVTRLITYMDKKERSFLEVYVPIEEIS